MKLALWLIKTVLVVGIASFPLLSLPLNAQTPEQLRQEAERLSKQGEEQIAAGQLKAALQSHQQALELYRKLSDRSWEGITLVQLADTYAALKDCPQAIPLYQQSRTIAREVENLSLERSSLWNLGECYEALGNVDQVIQHYSEFLPFLLKESDRYYSGNLSRLGEFLMRSDRVDLAEQQLREGIERMEANLKSFFEGLSWDEKGQIVADEAYVRDRYLGAYQVWQHALVRLGKPEAALLAAERSRARAFLSLINPNLQPPNLEEIRAIARQQNATIVEYSLIPERQQTPKGWQWKEDSKLFIWVVAPTGEIQFRQVDLTQFQLGSLSQQINTSRQAIGVRHRGLTFREETAVTVVAANPKERVLSPDLQKFYQILIQPIQSLLPTDPESQVVIVPQDSLFMLPFAALQDQTGKYFIEKHTLRVVPSVQLLAKPQNSANSSPGLTHLSNSVLIVGNPVMPTLPTEEGKPVATLSSLPGAEEEAKQIASLFKTKPLVGQTATKEAVLRLMQSAQTIHLATHGLLDDFSGNGIPGAIALAPTATQNGFLTAAEIANLKLKADLVVLSACDTGRGNLTGDGVIGLSRSFLIAGADSVIVSQWKVPDAPTRDLMVAFYQNLGKGQSKAQALRQAMLSTLEAYPSPRDWAAFVLMGQSN